MDPFNTASACWWRGERSRVSWHLEKPYGILFCPLSQAREIEYNGRAGCCDFFCVTDDTSIKRRRVMSTHSAKSYDTFLSTFRVEDLASQFAGYWQQETTSCY